MGVCEVHNEVMKNIQENIQEIKKKLDKQDDMDLKILEKLESIGSLKTSIVNLEKNFEEHKHNNMVHISKWWVAATILGSVIVGIWNLQGVSFI